MRTILLFLLALTSVHAEVSDYHGYTLYRIIPHDVTDVNLLRTLETKYEVWKEAREVGQPCDVMVDEQSRPIIEQWLREGEMEHRVMIQDVGDLIDLQARERSNRPLTNSFNYSIYHTLDEIENWIDDTARAYSDLVEIEEITKSYENRPVRVMKISTGPPGKPVIWFDSTIHAREWISPATILYMTNELLRLYGRDPDVTNILDNADIYVLPMFNPDGYEYTWTDDRLWRKTRSVNVGSGCHGCDPNRNWDIRFAEIGVSENPCSNIYPGPFAFSEVEVREVVKFMEKIDNLKMYMAYHNYGQMYMTPYGYQLEYPPDYDDLKWLCDLAIDAIADVHGETYRCNTLINLVGPNSGSSADYMYAVANIKYSYGVELRDTGVFGFLLPENQIIPTAEENYAAFIAMATGLIERL